MRLFWLLLQDPTCTFSADKTEERPQSNEHTLERKGLPILAMAHILVIYYGTTCNLEGKYGTKVVNIKCYLVSPFLTNPPFEQMTLCFLSEVFIALRKGRIEGKKGNCSPLRRRACVFAILLRSVSLKLLSLFNRHFLPSSSPSLLLSCLEGSRNNSSLLSVRLFCVLSSRANEKVKPSFFDEWRVWW